MENPVHLIILDQMITIISDLDHHCLPKINNGDRVNAMKSIVTAGLKDLLNGERGPTKTLWESDNYTKKFYQSRGGRREKVKRITKLFNEFFQLHS